MTKDKLTRDIIWWAIENPHDKVGEYMFEKIGRLPFLGRLKHSGRLALMGTALLMMMAASCSPNGAQMGDKNGSSDNILRQNDPETAIQWTRVIVRLKVPDIDQWQAQSARLKDPAAANAMDQKVAKRIAVVADRVLKQVEPTGAKLIRRYDAFPMLALMVTPQAAAILKSMPDVVTIEADTLNPPAR